MKTCAIPCCRINSSERPDLCYFPLPRLSSVRDEWLDILELKRRDSIQTLTVCELHFRSKDFCESKKSSNGFSVRKKELKNHAVPVLRLNTGKIDPIDSDDEFIQCDSDSDPEILEITPKKYPVVKEKLNSKSKQKEIKIKEEPSTDLDSESSGRRPSRRAALVAAKKIFNTVRNYGIKDDPGDPVVTAASPKTPGTPRPYSRQRQKKGPPVNVDLLMECCDDFLSPVQAECLLKAQIQYNMVMKNLRELMACNVKVIQTEPPAPSQSSNGTIKNGNSATKTPKSKTPTVVPMILTPASQSPTPIILF